MYYLTKSNFGLQVFRKQRRSGDGYIRGFVCCKLLIRGDHDYRFMVDKDWIINHLIIKHKHKSEIIAAAAIESVG
jgi:hypothetical protein